MLKFLLSRILPRERAIKIDLPHTVFGAEDPVAALVTIIRAVPDGTISPSEGAAVTTLIDAYRRATELAGLAKRTDELEAALKGHE